MALVRNVSRETDWRIEMVATPIDSIAEVVSETASGGAEIAALFFLVSYAIGAIVSFFEYRDWKRKGWGFSFIICIIPLFGALGLIATLGNPGCRADLCNCIKNLLTLEN